MIAALAMLTLLLPASLHATEVWKVEHSAVLRKHVPGTPQYADTEFSSKAECEKGIDQAVGSNSSPTWRKNYICFLAGSSGEAASSAPSAGTAAPAQPSAAANLGTALVKNIFSPTQTGHNIEGENNFQDFDGKKPDALGRDKDKYGFLAAAPAGAEEAAKQDTDQDSPAVQKIMAALNCVLESFLGEFSSADKELEDAGVQADLEIIRNTLRISPSGKKNDHTSMSVSFSSQGKKGKKEKQFVGSVLIARDEETGEVRIYATQSSIKDANLLARVFGKKTARKETQNSVILDRFGEILNKEVTGTVKKCLKVR